VRSRPRDPRPATTTGARPSRRGQLRRGLTCPSVLVVIVALLAALGGVIAAERLIVSGYATAVPESLLLIDPPDRTAVYVLGGSSTRESFVGERSLATRIAAAGGGDVVVHELASNNQEFGGDLAIIDNLPQTPAIVVIGVGMERFVHGPRATERQTGGRPLLLSSPALRAFLEDQTGDGGGRLSITPGMADFAVTWAHWRLHRLRLGKPIRVRFRQHLYTRSMAYSDDRKRDQVQRWLQHRGRPGAQFDRVLAYNAAALEGAVALARERGFDVVLAENPLNLEIVGTSFDRMQERYQPLCRDVAARHDATYVDFVAAAGLRSHDFRDLTHMLYPGEVKYESELARVLAARLAQLRHDATR
jgi:hypothetical protein